MIEVGIVIHLRKNKKVNGWKVTDRVPLHVCTANTPKSIKAGWIKLSRKRLTDRRVMFHNFDRSQYCNRYGYLNTWAAPRNML